MKVRTKADLLADLPQQWHDRCFSTKWHRWCRVPSALKEEDCEPDDRLRVFYEQLMALPTVTEEACLQLFGQAIWERVQKQFWLTLTCDACEHDCDAAVELWEFTHRHELTTICARCLQRGLQLLTGGSQP